MVETLSKAAQVAALRMSKAQRRVPGNNERRNEGKADAVPVARTSSEMPQPNGERAASAVAKGSKNGVKPRTPSAQEGCVPLAGQRAAHELTSPDFPASTTAPKIGRPRKGESHVPYRPWEAMGISERTWYRRKAEQRRA